MVCCRIFIHYIYIAYMIFYWIPNLYYLPTFSTHMFLYEKFRWVCSLGFDLEVKRNFSVIYSTTWINICFCTCTTSNITPSYPSQKYLWKSPQYDCVCLYVGAHGIFWACWQQPLLHLQTAATFLPKCAVVRSIRLDENNIYILMGGGKNEQIYCSHFS